MKFGLIFIVLVFLFSTFISGCSNNNEDDIPIAELCAQFDEAECINSRGCSPTYTIENCPSEIPEDLGWNDPCPNPDRVYKECVPAIEDSSYDS